MANKTTLNSTDCYGRSIHGMSAILPFVYGSYTISYSD